MTSEDQRLTGGELLAKTLVAAGVKRVFALHGGHLDGFFKGCVEADIDLVAFRHEAAAGHAADAYARTTGELGVCAITAGPGFTNGLTAIANAQLDGSPVLFIIGAAPLREIETNPLQGGIDQIAAARPLAKWAISVPVTERIPDLAAMAIRKALTGRKGAVVLEVPIDVLHAGVRGSQATTPAGLGERPHPAPSPDETRTLRRAPPYGAAPGADRRHRGGLGANGQALVRFAGAAWSPCSPRPRRWACAWGTPARWRRGRQPRGPADAGARTTDLVILLGARLGCCSAAARARWSRTRRGSSRSTPTPARSAGCVTSIWPSPLIQPRRSMRCWPRRATAASATTATGRLAPSAPRLLASAYPDRETPAGIHPYHAAAAVAEAVGPEAIWTLDGGEAASWAGGCISVSGPGRVLTHGYLGCLGTGLGFAIGAQIAHPDRRVIHVTGDGSMGFHIQEFDTIVRRDMPIVTVVLNNQCWGMCLHGQQIMYGQNYNVITRLGLTRYADIAAAFGCPAERVAAYDDIAPAMRRALDCGKPALLEIMTDPDVVHPITISMLGKVESAKDVVIPYYENIPAGAG